VPRPASVAPPTAASAERFVPSPPDSLEATGLSRTFLADHLIRTIYFTGEITGTAVAEQLGLPFPNVLQGLLEQLRREGSLEVRGQRGLGDGGFVYAITERGVVRAHEAMKKSQYRGAAPVPFDEYCRSVRTQSNREVTVTQENIRNAFSDLLIDDSVLEEVGPAVNSGSSMFLFGYPGNGKTSIAERITRLMGQSMFVPHAIEVDGEIIKLFDTTLHQTKEVDTGLRPTYDRRWMEIERPTVVVGGELTMAGLDLLYNETAGYYEAPLQMKANGGMFLIDDFGRQLVRPADLLNRWIVPLEKRFDYLTLITGKKIQIPFEELIVFSTNLDPSELVDEAFLRRIKFKINVGDPDEEQFRQIFMRVAYARDIQFDEAGFQYLLDHHYRAADRPLRMCQPRDLLDQLIAIARYKMLEPAMTPELINRAASTYFVTMSQS
jgi:predicted ATPase with chaperone activity